MEEQQDTETIQLNLAKFQRNAGRDYNEYFIPSNIKLVLATTPQAELDALAEDNGRMFRYRFGFSATRPVRRQVIELQQAYDLSDSEIRWLKHACRTCCMRSEAKACKYMRRQTSAVHANSSLPASITTSRWWMFHSLTDPAWISSAVWPERLSHCLR